MMRFMVTLVAVVLSLGAGFDLLITVDLFLSDRQASTVSDYLVEGAPLLAWAGDVLARAVPELILDPVMVLTPHWFFPLRALVLGLSAAALFAVLQARRN